MSFTNHTNLLFYLDGCNPTVYRVLDDVQRSPTFHPGDQDDLLCDDLLPPGWYRLMAQGNGLKLIKVDLKITAITTVHIALS